jgi:hypothetical protein
MSSVNATALLPNCAALALLNTTPALFAANASKVELLVAALLALPVALLCVTKTLPTIGIVVVDTVTGLVALALLPALSVCLTTTA